MVPSVVSLVELFSEEPIKVQRRPFIFVSKAMLVTSLTKTERNARNAGK